MPTDWISCYRSNRREETVITRLHIGLFCDTRLFIEGRGATCVYRMWQVAFFRTYFAFFGFDLAEARERHFTARSLRMLFEDISLDCISDYLKEIDILKRYNLWWSCIAKVAQMSQIATKTPAPSHRRVICEGTSSDKPYKLVFLRPTGQVVVMLVKLRTNMHSCSWLLQFHYGPPFWFRM